MRRVSLLASLGCLVFAIGCRSTEIGQSETDAAFPKTDPATIESELKKDPAAYAEWQKAKAQDRAYEQKGR